MGNPGNKYKHTRDANEPQIVKAAQDAGYIVDRLNGSGLPDLLLLRPNPDVPVYVVQSEAELKAVMSIDDPVCLVEVKVPGNRLTPEQVKWHEKARGLNLLPDPEDL